ncbi:protein FAM111A-like [Kryptolebias marmoratus]|uniref:protein FAM111A-like n=1 Tax=Kryptolebias marmoratus TaxID=37003 RepID=UPI0018ACCB5F|nr:protein FAM111A-like [Kryptolebias marmoratus]
MTNRSVGSAPNALKVNEKILNDENNRASALQDVSKEEILHSTHSLKWCSGDKRPIVVTCDKAGTVWDLLKKSAQFRKLEEKNKNKELVITRDGKALSSHFPCSLFQKDECVTVKFVKAVKQTKKPAGVSVFSSQNNTSCELVMFHVLAKGDKNITKIMRNPELRKIHEVTVYAYKGEKVKQALRRDGHFLSVLYKKNCALCCRSSGVNSELSNLVDDLSGKTFQITLLNKESVPNSIPSSLDEDYLMSNEGQSQSDSLNGSTYKKEACLDGNIKPEQIPQEETRLKKRLC